MGRGETGEARGERQEGRGQPNAQPFEQSVGSVDI